MLDVCLLGTGGMMPLKNRKLTSLMMRYNGHCVLVDCGEGTQIAIKDAGFTFKPIDVLCITHFHADHISGLPGLLLGMGNEGRTEPVTVIGPIGVEEVVKSLRIIAPELPFELKFVEISKDSEIEFDGYSITAFGVKHKMPCLGFSLRVRRKGKFLLERAIALNIPQNFWGILQRGESVSYDGIEFKSDMVLGKERLGLKVTYCTDSRPTKEIVQNAMDSDIFICEGMFYEEEKLERAVQTGHMIFSEAAAIAKEAKVRELWLTHFSPALVHPEEGKAVVKAIFKHTKIGTDGMKKELKFKD